MLNPYTRYISEEKYIVGRRHLACRRELAEGEQSFRALCESTIVSDSPRFFALRSVWNGLYFTKCLDFIKLLCTHDFSRVSFAAELSNNLVYNNIFVIDYDYLFFHLLFFIKMKLSI